MWIAFRFCIFVLWTQFFQLFRHNLSSCELLSDFVYSFFEHNDGLLRIGTNSVVNCFQILYIRSLNTINSSSYVRDTMLWIAFRFCIFVLWTQSNLWIPKGYRRCELLSDFVYSFFEHNLNNLFMSEFGVVNCFQILYIRSLNTMIPHIVVQDGQLWIAFRFCIFVLWTQCSVNFPLSVRCCELLSDFVYSFFEHNLWWIYGWDELVVNCFQILYIRSLNTMGLW